jgi:hypothetical protein
MYHRASKVELVRQIMGVKVAEFSVVSGICEIAALRHFGTLFVRRARGVKDR